MAKNKRAGTHETQNAIVDEVYYCYVPRETDCAHICFFNISLFNTILGPVQPLLAISMFSFCPLRGDVHLHKHARILVTKNF